MVTQQFRARSIVLGLVIWCTALPQVHAVQPEPHEILIQGFMFRPASTTIQVGESVIWTNKDDEPHTVSSDTGLFRSSALDTDETFTFRFDKPGIYHFICSIHPRMTGMIIVREH